MIVQRSIRNLQRSIRFTALLLLILSAFTMSATADNAAVEVGCDDGVGDAAQLEAAIMTAGDNGTADTISLAEDCIYTLTSTLTMSTDDGNPLTIEGNNAFISGNESVQVLYVEEGAVVRLNDLTIMRGHPNTENLSQSGGGIHNDGGSVTLTNSTVSDNTAEQTGGGIYNSRGTMTLIDTTVSSNTSYNSGGGITNDFDGILILTNTVVANNLVSVVYGSGGGILSMRGTVTLTDSTVFANTAEYGSAISNNQGTMTLNGTTVSNNEGNIYGAIENTSTLYLNASTVSGNVSTIASYGGGLSNTGAEAVASLINSSISGNRAEFGGGIYNAQGGMLMLHGSTISGNTANVSGGGLYNYVAVATLTNSTILDNTAAGDKGYGGGVYNGYDAVLTLLNSTISENTVYHLDGVGGLFNEDGTVEFSNTLIANSTDGDDCANSSGGSMIATGINLIEDTSCDISGVLSGDPLLADPTGSPIYLPLLPDSPAIDAGDDELCSEADQTGALRPQDGNADGTSQCDLGAYELTSTNS